MLTSFLHPRRHPHLHVSPAVYGNQGARAQACSHPPPLPIFLHHPYIYAPPVPISPPLPVFTILQPSSIYVYCSPLQESCGGFSMPTSPTPNSAPTFPPDTPAPPPPPPAPRPLSLTLNHVALFSESSRVCLQTPLLDFMSVCHTFVYRCNTVWSVTLTCAPANPTAHSVETHHLCIMDSGASVLLSGAALCCGCGTLNGALYA